MEIQRANKLERYLRDILSDVSYSQPNKGPHTLVVFLDLEYREALHHHAKVGFQYTMKEFEVQLTPFETYIGLNGDKCMLYWVENKGIDKIDIFVKYETYN